MALQKRKKLFKKLHITEENLRTVLSIFFLICQGILNNMGVINPLKILSINELRELDEKFHKEWKEKENEIKDAIDRFFEERRRTANQRRQREREMLLFLGNMEIGLEEALENVE